MHLSSRFAVPLSLAILACCGSAFATTISFTGAFAADDSTVQLGFTVNAGGGIQMRSYGYGGGVNGAATAIPAGGFDPYFALFTAAGTLVSQNEDDPGGHVATDPVTGAALDPYLSEFLSPGSYILVLSQSGNQPLTNTLGGGYTQTGNPAYTASLGCAAGSFCDVNADSRTANWAVDITGEAISSQVSTTPEPETFALTGCAGLALLLAVRKRRPE